MTVAQVRRKFEEELAGIDEKITALNKRRDVLNILLKELGGAKSTRTSQKPAKTTGKRGRKAKGGVSVRDAILQVVNGATEPLTAGQIVEGAGKVSGGAVASIRTQINALKRAGDIKQVPYEGRGYKYGAK